MEDKLKKVDQWPDEPPGSTRGLQLLAEAASEYFDVPLKDMKSKLRTNEVVWPRSVCMRLATYECYTSTAIGEWWGKHHSSVLHAIKLVDSLRTAKPGYEKQFRRFAFFYKSYKRRVETK